MEIEGFKTAWQSQGTMGHSLLSSRVPQSRSLQFLRASSIRDVHRSEEMSRLVFSFLFALLALGASIRILAPGASRIAGLLFAAALFADCCAGIALLTRRLHESVADTTVEFIRREHRQLQARLRLERLSQRLMLGLGLIALAIMLFNPSPVHLREYIFDPFYRMAIVTAFLALLWRRAKSRAKETDQELEQFLKDFEK